MSKKVKVPAAVALACLFMGFVLCFVSGAMHSQEVGNAKGWLGPVVGGIAYVLWICAEPGDTQRNVYFAVGFGATAGWVESGLTNLIMGIGGLLLVLAARAIEKRIEAEGN